ncbi:MAG TPA: GntR family transcriptional regulator [Firmicutes bacterium]|nr:GntR family transcriptional regulator [Candidatus Fermentithermobacillaceae bacterium]
MEEKSSFDLRRKGGLPIYLQVKRRIEALIASGEWKRGQRLPTERALAAQLGVSRNTVSLAYRQLEAEGLITSRQGRGTFVAEADDLLRLENKRERLNRVVDSALDDALALGVNPDEFLQVVTRRVEERRKMLSDVRIAFVECNREQLDYFSKELELGTGVKVLPVLTDDLFRGSQEAIDTIASSDMVVTTFFHLDEVRASLPERSDDILGIALDPDMETIVRIARLPPGSSVLLVCISDRFAERVKKSMENAGITEINVETVTERDPAVIQDKLRGKRAVIVSPGRQKEVSAMVKRGTPVIEFVYRPDAGSVNLLRSSVLEHRKMNRQKGVLSGE